MLSGMARPGPAPGMARAAAPSAQVTGGVFSFHPHQFAAGSLIWGAADLLYFAPWCASHADPITQMGFRITTGAGAGGSVKFAIYASSPTTRRPVGTPLAWQNTPMAVTGTGDLFTALAAPFAPVPGVLYFAAYVQSAATPLATICGVGGSAVALRNQLGLAPANSAGGNAQGFQQAMTFADDIATTAAIGSPAIYGTTHPEVLYRLT